MIYDCEKLVHSNFISFKNYVLEVEITNYFILPLPHHYNMLFVYLLYLTFFCNSKMYNRAEININFTSVQLAADFIVVYNIKDSVTLDPQYVKYISLFKCSSNVGIQLLICCSHSQTDCSNVGVLYEIHYSPYLHLIIKKIKKLLKHSATTNLAYFIINGALVGRYKTF